jgi:CubicO group peptidase (beta-lactamase class C family)
MRLGLILLAIASLIISCDEMLLGDDEPIISLEENLQSPPAINDGWDVSDLTAQNISVQPIHNLVNHLQNSPDNIHSLLIVRNNRLVLECYFTGWHRERLHALRSVSKTFMSTLVGIAVDKGNFTLDQKVSEFFPEYAGFLDEGKEDIEIRHLVTMTSGIKWDEKSYPGEDPRNDETAFDKSDHRFRYLFEKEMANSPGKNFEYNSALPVVEAAIIHKTTGVHAHIFAEKHFFKPLNITNYFWRTDRNDGHVTAIGPLFLAPRDMAKLGQLFLDSGNWKGQQVVSKSWVKNATTTFIGNEATADGYGYHWWTARYSVANKTVRVYFARGSGGQYIFVIPDLNSVVVYTGGNYPPLRQGAPVNQLVKVIMPAMMP